MKLKLCLIALAFAAGCYFSGCSPAEKSNNTLAVASTVNPTVKKFCDAIDDYVNLAKSGASEDALAAEEQKGLEIFATLDKNVVLSTADKDAIKKSYWDLIYITIKAAAELEGKPFESLSPLDKRQVDMMMQQIRIDMYKMIDQSRTLGDVERNMKETEL